jgi:hypothetical protein
MGQMLAIQTDADSLAGLRRRAKKEPNRHAPLRMLTIANALEGISQADAARVIETERQSLYDAVMCCDGEWLVGLYDHPKGHHRPVLSEGRGRSNDRPHHAWSRSGARRALQLHPAGPVPFHRGVVWQANVPASMSRLVRRLGLSRQKTRPVHPQRDPKAIEAFKKGGFCQP